MDAIIVIAVFLLCLGVPYAIAGLWGWFAFWWVIGITLAIAELISKITTGNTLSKRFWIWKDKPETPRWKVKLVFVGMFCFWTYLMGHLFLGW